MDLVKKGITAIFLMLIGAVLLVVIARGSGLSLAPNRAISGAEFVSIVLSALGVMLTAVTVFLGALAIIGWATFETRVQQSANSFMKKRFAEDDPDYQAFIERVEQKLNQNAEDFLEKRFSPSDPRYLEMVESLKRASLGGNTENYDDENSSPYDENAA